MCFGGLISAQKIDYNPNRYPINIENVPQKQKPNNIFKAEKKPAKLIVCDAGNFNSKPLYILDGRIIDDAEFSKLDPNFIESVNVIKGENATALYGEKGKNGVIYIKSKLLMKSK